MKLTIEIDDESFIEGYLSFVSLGVLECLKKGFLDFDDAMEIIYRPFMIDKTQELFPDLGNAILAGTQLVDVYNHIPHEFEGVAEEVRESNYKSISKLIRDNKHHIVYKLDE